MLLQLLSISLEVAVVFLGVQIATKKRRQYGWCIALTFGLYVLYDLANLFAWDIPVSLLRLMFFVASASIFYAVWQIYKRK